MKNNFFKKFFLVNTMVFVCSIIIIVILLSIFISNYITTDKKEMLKENCYTIATMSSQKNDLEIYDDESVVLFRAISGVTEAELFIADTNGNVTLCSCEDWSIDGNCEHNQKKISQNIINKVMQDDYNESGDLEGHFSQVKFTYSTRLYNSNKEIIGAVFATISSTNIRGFFNSILRLFLFSAFVPIIFMFFAEYYISYRFTKPLRLMAEASRSMAKGDFSKRIPVTGEDEIGELAVAFNQMTNSLVQLEGTRRHFIANISHEFKTPMTTIGGFIDGIIDGTIPPEKQGHYLEIISSEIKRLSRLVQSMLSLSKLESGELQVNRSDFDLLDMVFKIIVSQEQRIENRKLTIKGLEDISPTTLNADYDLIYQVVYNLIDNAIKFTNEKGTIYFEINSFNNLIQFKIRNTGEGIKEKDLPFVFERFYKTDRARSAVKDSTGLGLHLANAIISIHGGKISVQSKEDDYTEFTFVLPCKTLNENKKNKTKKQ
ncbi:MAG: HAMP domain-containing histidine kinase [Clostridia bacterium]|nr:HAMP domain-containing histidine kinase [Clostridia bacterium]